MIATIAGRRWRIIREKCRDAWGLCDDPATPNKAIRIDPTLEGEKFLETVLHETLHAAGWPIDEAFVETYARDAARLAYKLGFRQVKA